MRHINHDKPAGLDTPDELGEVMVALIEGFRLTNGFMTEATLRVFTQKDPVHLVNLGLIRQGRIDRWTTGFLPAGKLAAELAPGKEVA